MRNDSVLTMANQTAFPARLRFRCNGRPAWDAWVAPHGELVVPEPPSNGMTFSARYDDPDTRVAFVLPFQSVRTGFSVAAHMRHLAHANSFECTVEPGTAPQVIGLMNRSGGDVGFTLRFMRTPFVVQVPVRAGHAAELHPREFDVVATLEGTTSAALRIDGWHGAIEVISTRVSALDMPRLVRIAG